jgi:hypothetical protein
MTPIADGSARGGVGRQRRRVAEHDLVVQDLNGAPLVGAIDE